VKEYMPPLEEEVDDMPCGKKRKRKQMKKHKLRKRRRKMRHKSK
jgi:hypothetical protein